MYLSRVAALLVLLLSSTAMAEPSWGKFFDALGTVIENHAKNNPQQGAADNTNSSPQSTSADAGQSAEDINNSAPLALAPQSRSLERTLKLVAGSRNDYRNIFADAAGFFVTPTGKLVMWGSNEDVRLGLSEAKYTTSAGITEYQYKKFYDKPVVHPAFDDVVSVDACGLRTLVLTKKGEAWIFGKGGSVIPAAPTPTKIPGDGYIDARVTCESPFSHERLNLLKNDGSFWIMGFGIVGLNPGSIKKLPEPVKVASGVKALRPMNDQFVLLMNNGEVAMLNHPLYRGESGAQTIRFGLPPIMVHPKLKDIVRIDANDMFSGFIAYEANGNVYEVPLREHASSRLASGLDELMAMKRREKIDGAVFNRKNIRGDFSYQLPILTPELANAKNVCYGNHRNDGHLMKSNNNALYGLMLDNAGDVSVWASSYISYSGFNLKALGLSENKLIPQKIPFLSNVDEISCGALYFAVKTKNGDISIFPAVNSASLLPGTAEPNKMNFLFNENAEFYKTN